MSVELARTGLRSPVNVTWEVTLKCMLQCKHCLSDSGHAEQDELNTNECKDLINQLSRIRVFQVNIGGGEPFSRDDFLNLLTHAHNKKIVTCVSTNGMLIDNKLAQQLSALKGLYLQLSLDGSSSDVNDAIRGEGTYRQILTAADCLTRHGVKFSFNMVLTRLNYPELDNLRTLSGEYGAQLRVSRFRPSGRGKCNKELLGPNKDQLEAFASWLEEHELVRTGDSFFCLTSENRRRKGLDMCGAAKMTCCISPSGNVYPCAFLQEKPFLVGNVRQTSFDQMWKHSQVLSTLRNLEIESCQTCDRFESCRGGCPAMAYHTYHDINMSDPECLVNLVKLAKEC